MSHRQDGIYRVCTIRMKSCFYLPMNAIESGRIARITKSAVAKAEKNSNTSVNAKMLSMVNSHEFVISNGST